MGAIKSVLVFITMNECNCHYLGGLRTLFGSCLKSITSLIAVAF